MRPEIALGSLFSFIMNKIFPLLDNFFSTLLFDIHYFSNWDLYLILIIGRITLLSYADSESKGNFRLLSLSAYEVNLCFIDYFLVGCGPKYERFIPPKSSTIF